MSQFKCPGCGCREYSLHYNSIGVYRQCKECGTIYYNKVEIESRPYAGQCDRCGKNGPLVGCLLRKHPMFNQESRGYKKCPGFEEKGEK